ncbi:glycosyltransferase family 92 protein [Ruficoccus sp. ZRK36]|uniref:glycosyltransferase family 92 protein n=1 Tax=Ruficoccus sp. ZRK36 TaxID=2866311 RepID=UPI001C73A4ED|nr:glycosyltransferase family 92 protein [Ruficoccus sp. ZRK36]QYY36779.1 glycosyltransferase family 92 protein [Ruficoccus sp. ZRK36]
MSRRIHKKSLKRWAFLCLSPWLLLRWLAFGLYEWGVGRALVERQKRREAGMDFEHELSVVAIAKNEGLYVREWVEYHRLIGVGQIIFYDNESTDGTAELLQPYIQSGFVKYHTIVGKAQQLPAYNDAVRRYRDTTRFMAFIDLDEFMKTRVDFEPIGEVVSRLIEGRKGAVGIGVNWHVFGGGFHKTRPDGLVIESYTRCSERQTQMNAHIKTICNPRFIKEYISPHFPLYVLGASAISLSGKRIYAWFADPLCDPVIRVNHYSCKSEEDYQIKMARGMGDRIGSYDMTSYRAMDLNDCEDISMMVYACVLKQQISKVMEL